MLESSGKPGCMMLTLKLTSLTCWQRPARLRFIVATDVPEDSVLQLLFQNQVSRNGMTVMASCPRDGWANLAVTDPRSIKMSYWVQSVVPHDHL